MKGPESTLSGPMSRTGWIIAVIAVLLVPLIYSAIILTAKWGPYDNLANLPVAVVNKDQGGESGGEPINVGNDLIASLKGNNSLGFKFVSEEEADKGMKNLKYYMKIEVPEDFSQKVTTVLDENPQKPELKFVQNEGLHFMAAQVTKTASERIQNQLADQVTATYTKSLLTQLSEIASGFKDGADGSGKINDGAGQLKDGTGQIISSLEEKAPDIARLSDGANELYTNMAGKQGDIAKLADGANELYTNMAGKQGDIAKLADGAKAVDSGAK